MSLVTTAAGPELLVRGSVLMVLTLHVGLKPTRLVAMRVSELKLLIPVAIPIMELSLLTAARTRYLAMSIMPADIFLMALKSTVPVMLRSLMDKKPSVRSSDKMNPMPARPEDGRAFFI
jgi:hypothetical protein